MLRRVSARPRAWLPPLLRWGPLAACAVVLAWHSLRFGFVTDDAYISFVYARNLAEHGELTFNLGDPVEGYTNFLWTALLAAGMVLGVSPEVSSQVLGLGLGVGVLVTAFRLTERLLGRPDGAVAAPWAWLPPALLALSSGFACWTSGGLETQLFCLLVLAALDAYAAAAVDPARLSRVGALLAGAAMTRPEGLLVAGLVGLHHVAVAAARDRRWPVGAHELRAAGWFLGLWGPWFAWRWWYYGWPFPNTYYVKAAGDHAAHCQAMTGDALARCTRTAAKAAASYQRELREVGWFYVSSWAAQSKLAWGAPLLLSGLVPRAVRSVRFGFVTLAAPLLAVYLAYVVSVGGDFMGLHRFVLPLLVVCAVLAALGAERLVGWLPARARTVAGAALAVAAVVGFGWAQQRLTAASLAPPPGRLAERGIDTPAYLIAYTENRAAIGRALAACVRPDDFAIVGGAGAQPYFARMRAVDVFGLVSDRVAHEVPPRKPRPGHNKWAPDELLAEYAPTLVFHCYSIHAAPKVGPLGCGRSWLQRGFEQVTLEVPGLDGRREARNDAGGDGPARYYTFLARKDRALDCPGLRR